jgi:ATP-dependent helicase/nuclease subunit B
VLTVHKIQKISDKKNLFDELANADSLWVVSTTEAKRRLQMRSAPDNVVMNTQNILRATEYWSWLFQMNVPEKQLVSDSLFFVLLENWYKNHDIDIQFQDIKKFKTLCDQIFPILVSAEKELFYDWLGEDEQRSLRLLPWIQNAQSFLEYLQGQDFVSRSWLISSLLEKDNLYFGAHKKFIFDLGNEIQPEEAQMILKLSETQEVDVIAPWTSLFVNYRTGRSYQKLDAEYALKPPSMERHENIISLRSSSVLNEVKSITSFVRERLDGGTLPHQIAIVAADPEQYWDMVKSHFDVEGVPLEKGVVTKVMSLPYFHDWLAKLKVLVRNYTSGDLESFLNAKNYFSKNKLAYLDFKKNFSRLYEVEMGEGLIDETAQWSAEDQISFSDFISFLYATWTYPDYTLYNKLADALIKDFKMEMRFSFSEWHNYLNMLVAKMESGVEPPVVRGVIFTGPHQTDHSEYTHLVVLGCHRSAMQVTTNSPFLPEDVAHLDNDLGYYLPPYEDKKVEIDLRWAMTQSSVEILLSYPETDFVGDPYVVSQMWLEQTQGKPVFVPSFRTRWDSIMRQPLNSLNWQLENEKNLTLIEQKMDRDLSLDCWKPIETTYKGRLSASAFARYDECAFLFLAERHFKLSELRQFDLEIDFMFQGNVLHRIVEVLLLKYPQLDISEIELKELYDQILLEKDTVRGVSEDILTYWRREKFRHLIMIRRFLEEEKNWRLQHPQLQVVALEAVVSGYIGLVEEEVVLSVEPLNDTFLAFAGKIDRIDKDSLGQYGIYDYKTSKNKNMVSFEKWPTSFQMQMPLYATSIENGLVEGLSPASVVMAAYIFFKDSTRGNGFVLTDRENGFVDLSSRKHHNVTHDTQISVFAELYAKLKEIFIKIQEGHFMAQPKDVKTCDKCAWRRLCRAPHLR